jgi:DNA (cytosine-5)-methyltransferase 1
MKKLNVIDLFSGAGGLSEGFSQTGKYEFLAHVEWEHPMVETLRSNLVDRWGYTEEDALKTVVEFDIQKTHELINGEWSDETKKMYEKYNHSLVVNKGLKGLIGENEVDIIVGGPPCQAYSIAGRAQDPHSMKNDYRNYLFEGFVEVVKHFKPKVFVFENVPGMLSAKPGDRLVIERVYEAFKDIGYEIRKPKEMKKSVYTASNFSVPQERRRVIIIGIRKDSNLELEDFYLSLDTYKSKGPKKTVRDAIGNMPKFRPLDKSYKSGRRNVSHELIGEQEINLHEARYHNKRDIKVFYDWISKNMNSYPTKQKTDYYKKVTGKDTNHNKYRSLEWDKPSPTIVAHLHKDGLMFIHPDINQLRSITVREAALLQSFPLDFEFVGSNAYCFKMIGNAVPVLMAKAIANAIYKVLEVDKREKI